MAPLTQMTLALFLGGTLLSAASDKTGHRWTSRDFDGVLSVGLEGHRNFQRGSERFKAACAGCHTLGKFGGGQAVDLTRRALTYTPEELLSRILEPAHHSPAPARQLNAFPQSEMLDLLAFVLSAADATHSFFLNP
jgi:mono/diheme cytochrome c family protein